jgi:hypothetical protein
MDHDKENWEVADERLRAWCQRCHLAHDRQHHMNKARMTRITAGEWQPELGL